MRITETANCKITKILRASNPFEPNRGILRIILAGLNNDRKSAGYIPANIPTVTVKIINKTIIPGSTRSGLLKFFHIESAHDETKNNIIFRLFTSCIVINKY